MSGPPDIGACGIAAVVALSVAMAALVIKALLWVSAREAAAAAHRAREAATVRDAPGRAAERNGLDD